jgi:hypothetical protein
VSRKRWRRIVISGGLFICIAGSAAGRESPSIARLSWLAGCWERTGDGRHVEEQWMAPRGGTMLGMGRTVTGGSTSEHEQMQIREEGGRLIFTAKPSGQAEASFVSLEVADSSVVFENKAHDFPQRIIYRLQPDGSLLARIEGERGGKQQGVDFSMSRAVCGGASGR